jgi:hypothetical protein
VFNLEALIQRFHLLLNEQFEGLEATTCIFFEFVLLLEQTLLQASKLFVRIPHHRAE